MTKKELERQNFKQMKKTNAFFKKEKELRDPALSIAQSTKTILEKLEDLYEQATTEHSHFYTAKVIYEAIKEIEKLQKIINEKNKI